MSLTTAGPRKGHERRRQNVCTAGSAGMSITSSLPLSVTVEPGPDGAGEIGEVQHDVDEAVAFRRIVRRPKLEHHLVVVTEQERLHVPPRAQIPEVKPPAVLLRHEQLRLHAMLDLRRCPPFARDHRVPTKVPPEVVRQLLRSALDLPGAKRLEGVVVEHEDSPGARRRVAMALT